MSLSRPLPRISIPIPRLSAIPSLSTNYTDSSGKVDQHEALSPLWSGKASPGHVVKHTNAITLILGGQHGNSEEPIYSNGDTVEGMLAISRSSGLLSVEIQIEGFIKLREVAGGGNYKCEIVKETLYFWDALHDSEIPSKINFQYTLPSHYKDYKTGEKHRLPPSFSAHVQGIPGYNLQISYYVTVLLTRTRDKSDWWRKDRRFRLPFRYQERTRPLLPGPFPLTHTKSPQAPKTLFRYSLLSRKRGQLSIKVQLFLPWSRVFCLKQPIPFTLTFVGDDEALEPFSAYHPTPSSFLSLYDSGSISQALQAQIIARTAGPKPPPPIRVYVQRRVQVDARTAGMPIAEEKSHMLSIRCLAQGEIHNSSRGKKSMTWSGTITIPPTVCTGGFSASGVKVTDSLVLSISTPEHARSRYAPVVFSETIPIRLTTETYDCPSATVTVEDWD
ncbi:hypothetical protein K474DRAFT_1749404 [Panus rudis PR-1116 ss-1]|nr:hypothetical protein K474DRAFT_1749404 [Panus rudis PR-1116 ss-1]